MDLDEAEVTQLRRLVAGMIPSSSLYDVPGADDAEIFGAIVKVLRPRAALVRNLLAGFVAPDVQDQMAGGLNAALAKLAPPQAEALAVIIAAVAQCYYVDDRVMRSLGMDPRPPFPKGFEVQQGDWALLEPVRLRGKLWRDAS